MADQSDLMLQGGGRSKHPLGISFDQNDKQNKLVPLLVNHPLDSCQLKTKKKPNVLLIYLSANLGYKICSWTGWNLNHFPICFVQSLHIKFCLLILSTF